MKALFFSFVAALLTVNTVAAQASPLDFLSVPADPGYRQVSYIEGQILDVDVRSHVITLMDGTAWEGGGMILLPVADIIILPIPGESLAVAYSGGMMDVVRLVGGTPIVRSGLLVKVTEKNSRGDVLKLSSGDVVELGYDSYRAATWLPPFDAVVTGRKIYNLRRGQSVQATTF